MRLITQLTPERTKRYLIFEGKNFETHKWKVSYQQIQQLWEGTTFELGKDRFLISRPNLEDYILLGLKRKTQIIYPSDIAQLIITSWIKGWENVFESGIGSWALSLWILHALKNWKLVSIEAREDFANLARDNIIQRSNFANLKFNHQIIIWNFKEVKLVSNQFDIGFLDMKEAAFNLDKAYELLKPGWILIIWVPTANQVAEILKAADGNFFAYKLITLNTTNRIRISARLRPEDFQVGSRWWIIKLIKIKHS